MPDTSTSYRDYMVMWVKDLRRAIDYLETRPEFGDRIAFYGLSWAGGATIPAAIEDCLSAMVLVSLGFFGPEACRRSTR